MIKTLLTYLFLIVSLFAAAAGCAEYFAIAFAPEKEMDNKETALSKTAEDYFWTNFHEGNYDSIPRIKYLLTAAYLENPSNSILAAHIAFTNMWELAERKRAADPNNPTIIYNATVAKKFFDESYRLNSDDARILGFLGAAQLTEGSINEDEEEIRRGYYTLKHSVSDFPEFNDFTMGYMLTQLDRKNDKFSEGLDYFWDNLDDCTETDVSRSNPDYKKFMKLETTKGDKRVCWNGQIAPHNFEGFFMAFGDALVKAGKWQMGIKMYNNAKYSKTYNEWKFKDYLEDRIQNAGENVKNFNDPAQTDDKKMIMFRSSFSCMSCHRN